MRAIFIQRTALKHAHAHARNTRIALGGRKELVHAEQRVITWKTRSN